MYYNVWRMFNEFYLKLDEKPENWTDRLTLFVGYLIQKKRKSNTIRSYVCAIKVVLKDDGFKITEDDYLISCLTKACRIHQDVIKIRLPVEKHLVHDIIDTLDSIFKAQPYLLVMNRALFITTYYGLFHIGEVTTGSHPIKATDVYIAENKKKVKFILRSSKTHCVADNPQVIKITSTEDEDDEKNSHCPFKLLRHYFKIRKTFKCEDESFFIFKDRTPVTPANMRSVFQSALTKLGYDH